MGLEVSDTKTFTIGGVTVNAGDEVEATVKGIVQETYGDLQLKLDSGANWWVNTDHKLKVTKKAGPKEPAELKAVVRGTNEWGDSFTYVKLGSDKWLYIDINSYGGPSYRTWDWLVNNFKNGKLEVLSAKPGLPKDHVVRDLKSVQAYKRSGFSTMNVYKESGPYFNFTNGSGSLREAEAIALAWDILKLTGQVQ